MATSKLPMTAVPPTTPPTTAPMFKLEAVLFTVGASMEAVLESGKRTMDAVLN